MTGRFVRSPRGRLRGHLSVPFFRNAYLLILSSLIVAALGIPFWVVAARRYSAETVGKASTIISAMMLVSGISQLGMSGMLVRYIPAAAARTRRLIVTSYVSTAAVSLFAGALAAATSGVWSPPVRFLGDDAAWFAFFVCATLTWTVFSLQDSVMTGMREVPWVTLENAAFALAKLVLVAVFASRYPHVGIVLALVLPACLLTVPVNLAIFLHFTPRHAKAHGSGEVSWRGYEIRRLVTGNYIGSVLALLGTFCLPILVADELGIRRAAYFFVPWTMTLALALVAVNMMSSMVVEAAFTESRLREYSRTAFWGMLRLLVPAVVAVFVLAPNVLDLFGHEYARQGTWVLRLMAVGTIPLAVLGLGLSVARIRHDGRFVARVQGAEAAVALGLSAVLLPFVGANGAALGWLTSQTLAAAMTWPLLRRVWRVEGTQRGEPDPSIAGDAS